MTPPIIYVASPYKGNAERGIGAHIAYAHKACRDVLSDELIPYAPHLFFPQFLNDNIQSDRDKGMGAALFMLSLCAALYVYQDYGISAGMETEIAEAKRLGIPVKYRTILDPPTQEKSSGEE